MGEWVGFFVFVVSLSPGRVRNRNMALDRRCGLGLGIGDWGWGLGTGGDWEFCSSRFLFLFSCLGLVCLFSLFVFGCFVLFVCTFDRIYTCIYVYMLAVTVMFYPVIAVSCWLLAVDCRLSVVDCRLGWSRVE